MGILTEPVTGWRHYGVSIPGLLTSNECVVMPRERAESFCQGKWRQPGDGGQGERCLLAPKAECTCGFYAFKDNDELWDSWYATEGVIAEVSMWGTVHVFEKGFRAQYVYPRRMWVWGPRAESCRHRLQQEYMVPVGLFATDFANVVASLLEKKAKNDARWAVEPLSEQQLWNMIEMGDDAATKTMRARLSSAICTRRKAVKRLEAEIARNKEELTTKLAQREGLKRAK